MDYRVKCRDLNLCDCATVKIRLRRDSAILTFLLTDVPAFEAARIIVCAVDKAMLL